MPTCRPSKHSCKHGLAVPTRPPVVRSWVISLECQVHHWIVGNGTSRQPTHLTRNSGYLKQNPLAKSPAHSGLGGNKVAKIICQDRDPFHSETLTSFSFFKRCFAWPGDERWNNTLSFGSSQWPKTDGVLSALRQSGHAEEGTQWIHFSTFGSTVWSLSEPWALWQRSKESCRSYSFFVGL